MQTLEQRYREATLRLRSMIRYDEAMAKWKEDLGHRLWRAEITLKVTGEALGDIARLEAEVRQFGEVAKKLKEWLDGRD